MTAIEKLLMLNPPMNISAFIGDEVEFRARLSYTGSNLHVYWQRNHGKNVLNPDNLPIMSTGEFDVSFHIPNVTVGDSGHYQLRLSTDHWPEIVADFYLNVTRNYSPPQLFVVKSEVTSMSFKVEWLLNQLTGVIGFEFYYGQEGEPFPGRPVGGLKNRLNRSLVVKNLTSCTSYWLYGITIGIEAKSIMSKVVEVFTPFTPLDISQFKIHSSSYQVYVKVKDVCQGQGCLPTSLHSQ
eukprot:m.223171 g.223171  ORF g.223171 m.223171 type:complete len:238 (+) comp39980_c1_seq32:2327-3040(+)